MAIRIQKGFVLRKIGPQYMAVPYGAMTAKVKGMVTLTESGYLLWQAIEKGTDNMDALVELLMETYEVEREVAVKDANDFVAFLTDLGAVEA